MKARIFTVSCLMFAALGFGQNYWSKTNTAAKENLAKRDAQPKAFSLFKLNAEQLKSDLAKVPQRFSPDESHIITFPGTDGGFKEYIVQEASVMAPELQAKFPEIRSYVGWERNNPQNSIRFSVTPQTGVSAMYFDGWEVSYLDQYTNDHSQYIFYKRKELPTNDRLFECTVEGIKKDTGEDPLSKAPLVSDGQFRTYRLALSGTGEYTAFHGGTVERALAAMAVTMTRVNGIYEKSISVTMVMIPNNDLIVYTNAATDPFTNGNPGSMITQNQTNTNTVIGAANYDIGHVFGTNSGGLAGLGVVCTTSKARGVTGSGAPVNDPFDIDYVAHEMGHQFGGNHTFRAATSSCAGNANGSTAFEVGSGSTIMAYAGICGVNNLQPNSDAYFHSASINEMYTVVRRASDCSVKTPNNNQVPTADAGSDYTIPKGTPFVLTGAGTDPDSDPITYLWEQLDSQNSTQPPVSTATVGPVYRSFFPKTSPSRYFPVFTSVLANNLVPTWEVTPSVARTLNFSLLVNDNKATGNQAARDLMVVTVADSGPFKVTSQPTNTNYDAGLPLVVTWDVAGTASAPVSTANVQILLSKDNGANFNVVLAASVPNNGTATVALPNEDISSARIMVKAVNNIYYAVNSSFFSVTKNLAVTENKTKSISVYPNPVKHTLNVKLANPENAKYRMYDAAGRLVNSGILATDGTIAVEKMTNGNYILTVELKNGEKLTEQILIKK